MFRSYIFQIIKIIPLCQIIRHYWRMRSETNLEQANHVHMFTRSSILMGKTKNLSAIDIVVQKYLRKTVRKNESINNTIDLRYAVFFSLGRTYVVCSVTVLYMVTPSDRFDCINDGRANVTRDKIHYQK